MSSSIWSALPQGISRPVVRESAFWQDYERTITKPFLHVAILRYPYLEKILAAEKTIESRFSLHRRLPYNRVNKGDVILLKESGGPIQGVAYVAEVWFYALESGMVERIKREFGTGLRIDDEAFWLRCEQLNYATLIRLDHVLRIPPIPFIKRDRNAWATFEPTHSPA